MQNPDITPAPLAYFDPGDGRRIAYRLRAPGPNEPTVLFLPGYASDMEGAKAEAIDAYCATAEARLPAARLFGHGFEWREISPTARWPAGWKKCWPQSTC